MTSKNDVCAFNSEYAPSEKQPPEGKWSTGLFDCLEDPSICLLTCFSPSIAFGRIVQILDRGATSCMAAGLKYHFLGTLSCGWRYAGSYRTKLRGNFSLPQEPCNDFVLHSFCCACSLSQEYRELKSRGIDPSIGWKANVEKWNREGVKPPIVEPGMAR